MFITYFNRLCQKHSRAAFIVIGFLIIIPFVFLWGSSGNFLRRGDRMQGGRIGEMYGHSIPRETFMWSMTASEVTLFLKYGKWISQEAQARDYWVQEALRRMRGLHEATNRGLGQVGDREVVRTIMEQPVLQQDGKFAPEIFGMFKASMLRPRGIDGQKFDSIIRENIILERLESQGRAGVFVAPREVRSQFDRDFAKLTIATCRFNLLEYLKDAEWQPAAADVDKYYQEHQTEFAQAGSLTDAVRKTIVLHLQDANAAKFYAAHTGKFRPALTTGKTPEDLRKEFAATLAKTAGKNETQKIAMLREFNEEVASYVEPYFVPEQKRARVAAFPVAVYKALAKVTDEQIQAYYQKNADEYKKEEVHAEHILLRVPAEANDEVKTAKRKQLTDLRAKIVAGLSFEEAAKKNSEDPGTKEKGGDLGWFSRGRMVEAFDTAAFALEKGALSQVIESPFGLHLIKVLDKRNGRTLADATEEIRTKLLDDDAQRLAARAAETFGDAVYRVLDAGSAPGAKAADLFVKVAGEQKEKVAYKDTEWFRNRGAVPPFGYEPALARDASKLTDQRPLSETIKGNDTYYVACWIATQAAYLPDIAKDPTVLVRVKQHVNRENAVAMAREKARAAAAMLQKELAAGKSLEAARGTLKFEDIPAFSRQEPPMRLEDGLVVMASLQGAKAGTLQEPIEVETGAVLVFLKQITPPGDADFVKEKDQLESQLRRQKEGAALQAFYRKLEETSKTSLADSWKPRAERTAQSEE